MSWRDGMFAWCVPLEIKIRQTVCLGRSYASAGVFHSDMDRKRFSSSISSAEFLHFTLNRALRVVSVLA